MANDFFSIWIWIKKSRVMLTFVNIFREGFKINLIISMEFPTGGGEGLPPHFIFFTTTKIVRTRRKNFKLFKMFLIMKKTQ